MTYKLICLLKNASPEKAPAETLARSSEMPSTSATTPNVGTFHELTPK